MPVSETLTAPNLIFGLEMPEETPEMYVARASTFLGERLSCLARSNKLWLPGDPVQEEVDIQIQMGHPMRVAMIVQKELDNPTATAAAWLHDIVGLTRDTICYVSYGDIANNFGFLVAQAVVSVTHSPLVEFEVYAKILGDSSIAIQTIKVACMMDTIMRRHMGEWKELKGDVEICARILPLMSKVSPELTAVVQRVLFKSQKFIDEVIGECPYDAPLLSSGLPATLGVYRMLSTAAFGSESRATITLTQLIEEAKGGVSEIVRQSEEEMLRALTKIHSSLG